jgi:hypothetical protein
MGWNLWGILKVTLWGCDIFDEVNDDGALWFFSTFNWALSSLSMQ